MLVFVIYEEFAMGLKQEAWLEMYRHATLNDHDFLFVDFQKPKRMRMMRNFEEYLIQGPEK